MTHIEGKSKEKEHSAYCKKVTIASAGHEGYIVVQHCKGRDVCLLGTHLLPLQVHAAHVERGERIGHHKDGHWQQEDGD